MATTNREWLTVDDLGEIHENCISASSQWYNIGLGLKVKTSRLENIKLTFHDLEDCLREVIHEWLKTECSPLTWENLSGTLRKQTIRQNSLANTIEKEFCQKQEIVDSTTEVPFEEALVSSSVDSKACGVVDSRDDDQPRSKLDRQSRDGQEHTESQFPFLKRTDLSFSERLHLEGTLHDAYEKIDRQFATVNSNVCDSLVERRIEPSRLAGVLRTLRAFTSFRIQSEKTVLDDCYEDISKANSITKIFDIIRDFVSFFSFGLLEHIIAHLGSAEDYARLQQYKEYFDEYCKRSVYECPSFSPLKEGSSDLVAKIDEDLAETYNMRKLKLLEVQFARIIEVSETTLKLCKVEPGCMELHYQIPRFVKKFIFPLPEGKKADLRRIGIIQLTCDSVQYLTTSPAKSKVERASNQRQIPQTSTKKIFERPRGGQRSREDSRKECSAYKLLGDCEFGPRCKFKHEKVLRRKYSGSLPYPLRLLQKIVIGRSGNNPNRAYITQVSEDNPEKELTVIAESEEALEEAKKELTILFAQLFPMRPGWTFIHSDAIVTPDLLLKFQECRGRLPWYHYDQKRTSYEIVCWHEAGAAVAASLEDIQRLRAALPQSDTVARVLETVDDEGKSVSNVRTEAVPSARFKLMTDRNQITQDLHTALVWLDRPENKKQFYMSKLEARFGKLAFSNLPEGLIAPDVSISVKDFAEFVFTDTLYKQIFNTEVKPENVTRLRAGLSRSFSMLETYDMKFTAKNKGHLDVRITFEHGKPRILQLKKDEHKVVVFDILCLRRSHDMRLSLSRFEVLSTSPLDAIMSRFLTNIKLTPQGDLQLVPYTSNWTVSYIRHKKREAFHLTSDYVVSISEIEEFQIKKRDLVLNRELVMSSRYNKMHHEVEFHNLAWISAFGRQTGLTRQQIFSPLIEERAIRDISIPDDKLLRDTTEMIVGDFEKEGTFQMIERLNEQLGGITT